MGKHKTRDREITPDELDQVVGGMGPVFLSRMSYPTLVISPARGDADLPTMACHAAAGIVPMVEGRGKPAGSIRAKNDMLRPAVLAWLVVSACAARGEEGTDSAGAAAQQLRVTAGAALLTDYIYRGISYSAHQPSIGAFVDVRQGWLYAWTNFNSVKFSTQIGRA